MKTSMGRVSGSDRASRMDTYRNPIVIQIGTTFDGFGHSYHTPQGQCIVVTLKKNPFFLRECTVVRVGQMRAKWQVQ